MQKLLKCKEAMKALTEKIAQRDAATQQAFRV
jgi:hypothetical protein